MSIFHIGLIFCFFPASFYIVHIQWQKQPTLTVYEQAPNWNFLPIVFKYNLLKLPFPKQSCRRMTVQISFKRNDWVFHAGPWFWPFVFWLTYPNVLTFWLRNFQAARVHLSFWPGCKRILRLLLVLRIPVALQWHEMKCFAHLMFISGFRQLPCWYFLLFSPFFFHCCLCIWYFHCLRHRNKLVHQIKGTS